MGSDSDLKTLKPAIDILREFGIKTEVCILSAHRTPIEMMEYCLLYTSPSPRDRPLSRMPSSA